MWIKTLAAQTGVPVDTIRFYERKGLLTAAHMHRQANGYRSYTPAAVERLQLIRRAQAAGFTLTEIEELFALWDQQQLDDQEIMQRLQAKYAQISDRIAELQQIQHYIADKLAQYQATP